MPPRITVFAPTMLRELVREAVLEKSFLDLREESFERFMMKTFH
jgi:hypothetical protein